MFESVTVLHLARALKTRNSTIFPFTTLFRSAPQVPEVVGGDRRVVGPRRLGADLVGDRERVLAGDLRRLEQRDRKSTRLNSSHVEISYAVFCLKKKNN